MLCVARVKLMELHGNSFLVASSRYILADTPDSRHEDATRKLLPWNLSFTTPGEKKTRTDFGLVVQSQPDTMTTDGQRGRLNVSQYEQTPYR